MLNSVIIDIFQKADIAEINSLKLYDYENSLNNYFNNETNSDFYKRYFKWFENNRFKKLNNSYLKDFRKWFSDYFF